MLCHDRAYQGEEQGLSTPVSVEGWHVVCLLSCVMAGYPKEGSWPTHAFCTCCLVSWQGTPRRGAGLPTHFVPVVLCHSWVPQGEELGLPTPVSVEEWRGRGVVPAMLCTCCLVSWQGTPRRGAGLPTLVSLEGWRGGGGRCTCHVVYLLSCVMAGYPKEKSWAYPHLCQWRNGEGGGLYLPCCVPVVLCHGRVPQGEELGLPTPVSVEEWRGRGVVPAMLCTCCLVSWQGTPRRRAGPTHTCVSGGMEREGGCTCHVVYLLSCVMAGYPKEKSWAYPHLCQWRNGEGGGGCTCHVVYLLSCVMAGYPKEEKNWAYPHLCQQMDGVFSGRQGAGHKLKVTDSLTSTLHSTFTTKSFTASTIKTCDTMSRGRAGSQEVEFSGMNISVGSGSNMNSHGGANFDVSGSCPACQGRANVDATGITDVSSANVNNHGAHLCRLHCRQTNSVGAALDGGGAGADNAASEGGMSTTSASRFSGFSNSGERNGGRCRECMESSSRSAIATGTCPVCGRELPALSANHSANDDDEGEWLEINDERKAWQLEGEKPRRRGRMPQPPDFAAGVLPPQREDNTFPQPGSIATQGFPPCAVSQTGSSKDADTDVSFEKRDTQKPFDRREAPKWDGEKGDARHHRDGCNGCGEGSRDGHATGFAAGTRLGGLGPELQPSGCGDLSTSDDPHRCCQTCDSKERSPVAEDSWEQQTVPTAVTSAADSGGWKVLPHPGRWRSGSESGSGSTSERRRRTLQRRRFSAKPPTPHQPPLPPLPLSQPPPSPQPPPPPPILGPGVRGSFPAR